MTVPNRGALRLILIALFATTSAGCATLFPEGLESRPDPLLLTVQNHRWSDVTVFLIRDDMRFRLGFVRAQSAESFRVSAARLGGAHHFQLFADPVGSDRVVVTRPIQVQNGSTTVWTLEESSTFSTVVVR